MNRDVKMFLKVFFLFLSMVKTVLESDKNCRSYSLSMKVPPLGFFLAYRNSDQIKDRIIKSLLELHLGLNISVFKLF